MHLHSSVEAFSMLLRDARYLLGLLCLLLSHCHARTDVLVVTIPVEVQGKCYCCAFLNAVESTLALRQSAEHFCANYHLQGFTSCVAPSLIVTPDNCIDRLERAFLQRLRFNERAVLHPILLNGVSYYFYAR